MVPVLEHGTKKENNTRGYRITRWGVLFFSLHSFFILFFCNCCKKYLIITIKKPGHRLKTKKVGSSIQVKPLAVRRWGSEGARGRGCVGARRRGWHLPTPPNRSFVFSSFKTSSQLSHGYEISPWTCHGINLSLSVNCRYTLPKKNIQKRSERSKSIKYNYFFSPQVHERATKVGRGLVAIGCEPSQKSFIGIYGPNRVEVWYRIILTSICNFYRCTIQNLSSIDRVAFMGDG